MGLSQGVLDAGYWALDTGCWILDAGYWMLVTCHWLLVAGFWSLDARYSINMVQATMVKARCEGLK